MTQTIEAVYTGGVLRPLQPLQHVSENATVKVTVEVTERHPFVDWVGGVSDDDAAAMRRAIDEEFEQVDPNDWK